MKQPFDLPSADDDLSSAQLKRLLSLAGGEGGAVAAPPRLEEARAALRAQPLVDFGGDPLALVVAADATLADFRRLKHQAKRLLGAALAPMDAGSARLVYHAAIAGALGRFGVNISRQALDQRRLLYEDLALEYDGESLGQLFATASRRAG